MEKKPVDSCFHMHGVAVSTCLYVGGMVEIVYATWEQALKNVAGAKHSCIQLRSCGDSKAAAPT